MATKLQILPARLPALSMPTLTLPTIRMPAMPDLSLPSWVPGLNTKKVEMLDPSKEDVELDSDDLTTDYVLLEDDSETTGSVPVQPLPLAEIELAEIPDFDPFEHENGMGLGGTPDDVSVPNPLQTDVTFKELAKMKMLSFNFDPQKGAPRTSTTTPQEFLDRQEFLMRTTPITDEIGLSNIGKDLKGRSIFSEMEMQNLNLVPTAKSKASLAQNIDRTRTKIGSHTLTFWIASAGSDKRTILRRHAACDAFDKAAPADKASLRALFTTIGENEDQVLFRWNKSFALSGKTEFLFADWHRRLNPVINQNPKLLTVYASGINLGKATQLAAMRTLPVVLPAYAGVRIAEAAVTNETATEALEITRGYVEDILTRATSVTGPLYSMAAHTPYIKEAARIFAGLLGLSKYEELKDWFKAELELLGRLQKRVRKLAEYHKALEDTLKLMKEKFPKVVKLIPDFHYLEDYLKDPEVAQVLETLKTNTFTGDVGPVFQYGNVLYAWRFFENEKMREKLGKAHQVLGQIDVIMSDDALKEEGFSRPRFVDGTGIKLRGVWNPSIQKPKAQIVKSDIELGGQIKNARIEGANKGGKSTLLRSIASCVALFQAGLRVPADEMQCPIFDRVFSVMNVSDNLETDESLHSEMSRIVGEITKQVKENPKSKILVLADEIFRGTNNRASKALEIENAREIGDPENTVMVLNSHNEDSRELLRTGRWKNYYIPARLDKTNPEKPEIVFNYQLHEGTWEPDPDLAFFVAQQAGISKEVIERARQSAELVVAAPTAPKDADLGARLRQHLVTRDEWRQFLESRSEEERLNLLVLMLQQFVEPSAAVDAAKVDARAAGNEVMLLPIVRHDRDDFKGNEKTDFS